jgi:hypothetical protein
MKRIKEGKWKKIKKGKKGKGVKTRKYIRKEENKRGLKKKKESK